MSRFGLTTSLSHHWCGSGSGFRHEKAEYRRRERISFERNDYFGTEDEFRSEDGPHGEGGFGSEDGSQGEGGFRRQGKFRSENGSQGEEGFCSEGPFRSGTSGGEAEMELEFTAERRQTLAEKVTLRTTVKRRTGYGQI